MRLCSALLLVLVLCMGCGPQGREPIEWHLLYEPRALPAAGEQELREFFADQQPLPLGCRVDSMALRFDYVEFALVCPGESAPAHFELHPSDSFHLSERLSERLIFRWQDETPPSLREQLEPSLKPQLMALDQRWDWYRLTGFTTTLRTENDFKRHEAGFRAFRNDRMEESLQIFSELMRDNPRAGALGMVVASVAGQLLTEKKVEQFRQQAESHPEDVLQRFIAGVAMHYYAHTRATTVEEKLRYYRDCLPYLEPAITVYPTEPRVYIYLAVTNFRLGNQQLAEEYIERAVALNSKDPDAFYCRAEIFQRTQVERSLRDLRYYIALQALLVKHGAVVSASKEKRVRAMLAHLIAVRDGHADPKEIFDPVVNQGFLERNLIPVIDPLLRSPLFRVGGRIVVSLLVACGLITWYRRRKRGPGQR